MTEWTLTSPYDLGAVRNMGNDDVMHVHEFAYLMREKVREFEKFIRDDRDAQTSASQREWFDIWQLWMDG